MGIEEVDREAVHTLLGDLRLELRHPGEVLGEEGRRPGGGAPGPGAPPGEEERRREGPALREGRACKVRMHTGRDGVQVELGHDNLVNPSFSCKVVSSK